MSQLKIRTEKPEERSRVATLIARAYGARGARAIEAAGCIRELPEYKDSLSMVGVNEQNEVVAYALFVPVKVGGVDDAAAYWSTIGFDANEEVDIAAFLEQVLESMKNKGWHHVLCHADAEQMKPFGFVEAASVKITMDLDIKGATLLARFDGDDTAPILRGAVDYPACLKLLRD